MKKVKWIIGIIIVLILAFLYAHIAKMNMIYDKHVDNGDYLSMGILEERKVEQSFKCVEDTLDGINVKCQTLGDVSEVLVKYIITDQSNGEVLAEGNCQASDIVSTKFNKLTFNTIENCRGKELLLTIWSESATGNNGISFYFQPLTEDGTKLFIDGSETQGTMIMKTVTNRFDFETFCVLLLFVVFIVVFMKILYKLFK